MRNTWEARGLSGIKVAITGGICLFSLISIPLILHLEAGLFGVFYCLATIPFACLPLLMSVAFRWRFHTVVYAVFSFYTLGPLLGAGYGLYYATTWWDDLLHILAGTLFAICGAYLPTLMNKGRETSFLLNAVFGLCFSMAIAVGWELFEFTSDLLLGSDMQADTIIHSFATKIGTGDGSVMVYEGIRDVAVNGTSLGLGGYLDIGLFDTMHDMAVETAGALVYVVYALIDRDRHPTLVPLGREKKGT